MSRIQRAALAFLIVMGFAAAMGRGPFFPEILSLSVIVFAAPLLSPDEWRRVFWLMLWVSVAVADLALLQIGLGFHRARGPFASPNFLAGYAAMHFLLAVRFAAPGQFFWLIPAGANGISLLLAQSRAGVLAWACGMAIVFLKSGRRALLALGVSAAGMLAIALQQPRVALFEDQRWRIWNLGLHGALLRPVLGWGPGGLLIPPDFDRFYNSALDVLIWGGVPGLIAGAWLAWEAWSATRRDQGGGLALRGLLAVWAVNSLFIYETAATAIPLFMMLGYLASEGGDVVNRTGIIDDRDPFLNRGVRADRPH